jgi:NitT/TauT family transport system substrate-binding protein
MKEVGLVDSGVTLDKGIGCFSDENQKTFYDEMAKAKVVPADVDISKIYTNQFVCKGVGQDLKK